MTLGRELRSLDVMNLSRLWITWATLSRELKVLAPMNRSRLWLT